MLKDMLNVITNKQAKDLKEPQTALPRSHRLTPHEDNDRNSEGKLKNVMHTDNQSFDDKVTAQYSNNEGAGAEQMLQVNCFPGEEKEHFEEINHEEKSLNNSASAEL